MSEDQAEALYAYVDEAKREAAVQEVEERLNFLAKAQLLENQRLAISGADISHIRHSDGGIDLARRVVNLQGAADWAVEALRVAAAELAALRAAVSKANLP